jgi:hypothetical protein
MIGCRLQGGLGNQMFQIAAAHALALRNNDISGFDFETCFTPLQGNPSNKYKDNVLSKVNNVSGYKFRVDYYEPHFSYQELPYTTNLLLNGHFQSEKYFLDFKNEIIDLFTLNDNEIVNNFMSENKLVGNTTSVHVRRGDYIKNQSYHPVCSVEYYQKAIKEIGNSNFIFISDDIGWVKDNFKGDKIYYFESNDEISDLTLMTKVNNNIIANSSFSWWGAYLNKNENKRVIAPKQWFGVMGHKDTQDIIPESWLIL